MATITSTRCDNCNREKRNEDSWLQVGRYQATNEIARVVTIGIGILQLADVTEVLDLCSHACLHKKIDELLKLKRPGRPRGSKNRKAEEQAA